MSSKITEIPETKWKGNRHFQSRKGFNVYYTGSDTGKIGGAVIVVDPMLNKALLQCDSINDRIISIHLRSKLYLVTVV